jgi:hypothetical protein
MTRLERMEHDHTLLSAASRYDRLRLRDALAGATEDGGRSGAGVDGDDPLSQEEALEMLALGEIVIRKAGYGRALAVRTARRAGASWTQVGAALGTTKQAAWEAHNRWIEQQATDHERTGYEGLTPDEAAEARMLAGKEGDAQDA